MDNGRRVCFSLIKIASVYMLACIALGFYMGVTHTVNLLSVHSHIGLLGWATMALAGLIYAAVPQCDGNKLALLHFWLHNIGLPVMTFGLVWDAYSTSGKAEAVLGVGSSLVMLALLVFALNLFKNCKSRG